MAPWAVGLGGRAALEINTVEQNEGKESSEKAVAEAWGRAWRGHLEAQGQRERKLPTHGCSLKKPVEKGLRQSFPAFVPPTHSHTHTQNGTLLSHKKE